MAQPCLHPISPFWKGLVHPELALVLIPLLSVPIPSRNIATGRAVPSAAASLSSRLHRLWLAAPSLPTCRTSRLQDKHLPGAGSAHTGDFPRAGDTAPGGGLHRMRAEQTRLGSNGIWERDIEGSWAGGRCRISPAAGTLGLNWVQIHHLLPLTPWRRQQSLCERALKIIPAQDAPGMLPSTSLVLPAAPGAPRRCSPWLTSIQLVIKSARRHLPFRSPFPSLPMVLLSSRTISLGWDRVAAFPLSLLARAGWEPTTPDGNPSPRRVPGNATTGAQGRQERGRLISALPSPSLSFILGVV